MSENATKNRSKPLAETPDSERAVAARSARAPLPATPNQATEQPERDRLAFFERVVWQVFFVAPFPILICAPFLFLVVFAVVALRFLFMRHRRRTSTAFGSARFANHMDMKSANLFSDTGLILGRALPERPRLKQTLIRLYTRPWAESRQICREMRSVILGTRYVAPSPLIRLSNPIHGIVVAPPGAGKSTAWAIPNLLLYPGSVICTDPKGELHLAVARVRNKRHGNRIVRLDPLGVCGPGGARINPLDFLDKKSPLLADACFAIGEALVVETGHEHDSHWNDCAKMAISAACLYVVAYAGKGDRNLNTVADLLTDGVAFAGMIVAMQDTNGDLAPSHRETIAYPLLKRFGNSMANWKERELSSIMSSVGRHLAWTNSPAVAAHLSGSTFDPRQLLKTRVSVFLILPPRHLHGSLSRLMRLWLTTLFAAITECGAQREREVLFLLDECGNLGSLPVLYLALTLGRGFGIRVWMLLQGLGQLKTLFPREGDHQSVEASIEHKIFFGIHDYRTAEELSNYLGSQTVQIESSTENKGTSRSGSGVDLMFNAKNWSSNKGTSATISETSRKLVNPDEILRLPSNIAIVLAKNLPPIAAQLVRFFSCPELADLMPDVNQPLDPPAPVRPKAATPTIPRKASIADRNWG